MLGPISTYQAFPQAKRALVILTVHRIAAWVNRFVRNIGILLRKLSVFLPRPILASPLTRATVALTVG